MLRRCVRSPIGPAGRTRRRVRQRSSHRSTSGSASSWPASTSSATARPRGRCRRSRSAWRSPGAGSATTDYVAPTPSLLAPYHRSPVSRFLLSGGSPLLISLFFGLLVCALLLVLVRRPKTTVVDRVQTFASERPARALSARRRRRCGQRPSNRYTSGWWAQLERDLELARMTVTPRQVVGTGARRHLSHRARRASCSRRRSLRSSGSRLRSSPARWCDGS